MYLKITEKSIESSEGMTIEDAMRLLGTATLGLMHGFDEDMKKQLSEEEYERVHGSIYDMYNKMAGNILDDFDCTRSPGTDLTARAILEAENAILDREVPDKEQDEEATKETTEEDPA